MTLINTWYFEELGNQADNYLDRFTYIYIYILILFVLFPDPMNAPQSGEGTGFNETSATGILWNICSWWTKSLWNPRIKVSNLATNWCPPTFCPSVRVSQDFHLVCDLTFDVSGVSVGTRYLEPRRTLQGALGFDWSRIAVVCRRYQKSPPKNGSWCQIQYLPRNYIGLVWRTWF